MSLSEQLYYGEIAPCEHTVPDTPEWKELGKQRSAEEHEILADMSEAQRERYDRVCETISRLNALETEKVFVSAFILGARMMLEILNAAGEELSSEFIIPHPRAKCKQNFRK